MTRASTRVTVLVHLVAFISCGPAPSPQVTAHNDTGPAPSSSSHSLSSPHPAHSAADHAPSTPSHAHMYAYAGHAHYHSDTAPSAATHTANHAPHTREHAYRTTNPVPPPVDHTHYPASHAHLATNPARLPASPTHPIQSPASPPPTPAPSSSSSALAPPPRLVLGAVGGAVVLPCLNTDPDWIQARRSAERQSNSGAGKRGLEPRGQAPDRRGAFWSWISRDGRHRGQVVADVYPWGSVRRYPSPLRRRASLRGAAFRRGDFSLRLGRVRAQDAGTFTCRLHEPGSGRPDFIRTLQLETVQVLPSHQGPLYLNSRLSLSCALSHWPARPPRVTWSLRGLPLATELRALLMETEPHALLGATEPRALPLATKRRRYLGDGGRSLTIRRLRLDDAGRWACHVAAQGGAIATATFDLRFQEERALSGPVRVTPGGDVATTPAPGQRGQHSLLLGLLVGAVSGAALALLSVLACARLRARNGGTAA